MTIAKIPTADATTEPSELDQLIAATGNIYYRKPFEKFARDGRISISWNWAASFFGMYWLFRRDMMAYAVVYLVTGIVFLALAPPWLIAYFSMRLVFDPSVAIWDIAYLLVYSVAAVFVFPCYANALYYGYLRRLLRQGQLATHPPGASRKRTKTRVIDYVAYIVVAVIIGLIAAVFIPEYQDRKVRASVVQMIAFAKNTQAKIEEYVRVNGKLPDRSEEFHPGNVSTPPYLGEIRIETGGTIRLTLTGPDLFATPNLEGKSIVLAPVFDAGKVTSWRCSSDIKDGHLPANCRTR